jgi:hypothetical protein
MVACLPFLRTPDDRAQVEHRRSHHPDPHGQQRCWLLGLLTHDRAHAQAERLAGVARTTAGRWRHTDPTAGGSARRTGAAPERTAAVLPHAPTRAEDVRPHPPPTVAEAAARLAQHTGVRRGRTPGRLFLRQPLGWRWRRAAAGPGPPKQTRAAPSQTPAAFRDEPWEPVLAAARAGHGPVCCGAAAHVVRGSFRCCRWTAVRVCLKAAAGRQRANVRGAGTAVTNPRTAVTHTAYVHATPVGAWRRTMAAQGLVGPRTLVLANARYQRGQRVQDRAAPRGIRLRLRPSDAPNRNRIARLWTFVRGAVLAGH